MICDGCNEEFDGIGGVYCHTVLHGNCHDTDAHEMALQWNKNRVSGEDGYWYGETRPDESQRLKSLNTEEHPAHGKSWEHSEESKQNMSEAAANRDSTHGSVTVDLTGNTVRSEWEKEVDILLHNTECDYSYEPETFELKDSYYTPDFIIDDKIALEVKGYVWRDPAEKAKQFMEMYPKYTYVVLGTFIPCERHIKYQNKELIREVIHDHC